MRFFYITVLELFLVRIILLIRVLVGVAFLTLLEREVLVYVHIRKAPYKVWFVGFLESFRNSIKLFTIYKITASLV